MILAIDVGNSNIAFGGFSDNEPHFVAKISTDTLKTDDEYAYILINMLSLYGIDRKAINGAIISSVVPQLNGVIKKAVNSVCGCDPMLVGPGVKTGLNIHCDTPSSVGSDLICACVAARQIYGSPAMIVDMGTATKIIVVDRNGSFIGVSIVPGAIMGLNALAEGTAQLPKVSLEAPQKVVAKNTVDCIKSGVVFGHASMIDGMIERIYEEIGEKMTVYGTGGLASVIVPHCKHDIVIDEDIVLKGLYIIYTKNN